MIDDLPLEVIKAIKTLYQYINENGYTDIKVDWLIGTVRLHTNGGDEIVITPIALDMMLVRQQDK